MGCKILLVDDDPELSRVLQEALETSGCSVTLCENGGDVLPMLRDDPPDLLVMDVMLPGLDGYSLAQRISNDSVLNGIPMIIMSALTSSRCMFEAIPQVKVFFAKPFNPEELLDAIRNALADKK